MGAHLRVALHRSLAPETPNWFTPPISTASFRLAARGLDAGWFIGAPPSRCIAKLYPRSSVEGH